jgi:hypothetical protein
MELYTDLDDYPIIINKTTKGVYGITIIDICKSYKAFL